MSDLSTLAAGLGLSDEQIEQLSQNLRTLTSAKLLATDEEVARASEGMRLTQNGIDLLAEAVSGKKLTFTKVLLGDAVKNGVVQNPTAAQILNYTKLIHQCDITVPLVDCRFAGAGTSVIKFQLNNSQLTQGFWAREIGLYAKVEGSNEVLYAYKNYGNLAAFIPASGTATAMNLIISLVTVIDQATNVTAIVDANLLFVSEAEFLEHISSTKPHPNIPSLDTEINTTNYIWVTGSDMQLHRISAENLQSQLLGSSLYELPHMNNRIAQTEINLSNLYTQLGSLLNNDLSANLLIAEDFTTGEMIDQFKVKVDDEVAGADNVCVESIDGVLEGHYYTISDGTKSQTLRVRSVARNGDLNVVFFDTVLKYTHNLPKTYLYRSTGIVTQGSAGGSGDVRDKMCYFLDTWEGEVAGKNVTLNLTTTTAKASNFTLSKYAELTSDGYFTIKD